MSASGQVASGLSLPLRDRAGWRLALFGIPVSVDLSALFGFALATWALADAVFPAVAPGRGLAAHVAAAALTAALLGLSVALHEAGHCVAARRAGLTVARVRLALFGGATDLHDTPRSAAVEIRVAMAGPVVSLACAVIAVAAHVLMEELTADPVPATAAAVVAAGNLALAVLNLVPALPLDGGRVLSAAVWWLTGREAVATRIATRAGRLVAGVLLVLSILASASGDAAVAVWAGLLGLVVGQDIA